MKGIDVLTLLLTSLGCVSATTFAISPATTSTAACNADNCLRAVRAVASPTRRQDCSYYAATTTTTIHFTTVTATPAFDKRIPSGRGPNTFSPTLPYYASACRGFYAYSSACRCAGVTGSVSVVTSTSTVTVRPSSTVIPKPFYIQGSVPGQQGLFRAYVYRGDLFYVPVAKVMQNETFIVDPNNNNVSPTDDLHSSFFYYAPPNLTSNQIYVISNLENGYSPLICRVGSGSRLECQYKGKIGVIVLCQSGDFKNTLYIARDANSFKDTCEKGVVVTPIAVTP